MTLVEQRCGAIHGGIVAVRRIESGFEIGRVVNGVRAGIRSKYFVMLVEAFAEVGGEAVVDRAAVGIIGVHVAERHAAGESGRIAVCVKPWDVMDQSYGLSDAAERVAERRVGADERRIQSAGPEKLHQRRIHIRIWTGCSPTRIASADGEWAGGSRLSRQGCIVVRCLGVGHPQVAATRVGVDGPVQMTTAIEIVSETEREASAEIS